MKAAKFFPDELIDQLRTEVKKNKDTESRLAGQLKK